MILNQQYLFILPLQQIKTVFCNINNGLIQWDGIHKQNYDFFRSILQKIKKLIDLMSPFKTQGTLIEFCDRRIHEAYSLKKLYKNHQIPLEHVVAFGNTINTTIMLMVSGIGVCTKNGSEDTLELANFISEYTCDVNGWVRFVIDHILIKGRSYK